MEEQITNLSGKLRILLICLKFSSVGWPGYELLVIESPSNYIESQGRG